MRTVVLVPRRSDGGRRDELWGFVREWMMSNHPEYPIYEGHHDGEKFSIAAARNDAARQAGDWDVAVILDSDTVAHPCAVREAVMRASLGTRLWLAGDVYCNMDRKSSDRAIHHGMWWPRPNGYLPKNGTNESIYGEPSSGVIAVSRPLWDAIGGYLECLQGWGYEDLVFMTCANIFGDGIGWLPDETIYHLWHPQSRITEDTQRNYQIWKNIDHIARNANKAEVAREYMGTLGHTWPRS